MVGWDVALAGRLGLRNRKASEWIRSRKGKSDMSDLQKFAELLASRGVIDECAVFDPDAFDEGRTMERVALAFRVLEEKQNERIAERDERIAELVSTLTEYLARPSGDGMQPIRRQLRARLSDHLAALTRATSSKIAGGNALRSDMVGSQVD